MFLRCCFNQWDVNAWVGGLKECSEVTTFCGDPTKNAIFARINCYFLAFWICISIL